MLCLQWANLQSSPRFQSTREIIISHGSTVNIGGGRFTEVARFVSTIPLHIEASRKLITCVNA